MTKVLLRVAAIGAVLTSASVLARQEDDAAIDADQLVAQYYQSANALNHIDCQFEATVFSAGEESEWNAGSGDALALATGRLVHFGQHQALFVQATDTFRVEAKKEGETTVSFFVPFPGSSMVVKNDELVLELFALTTAGTLGSRGAFFPRELFNPLCALGVVGSDKYCNPVSWLLEPPAGTEISVNMDGTIAKAVGVSSAGTFETWFDLEKEGAICHYSLSGVNGRTEFWVDEFMKSPKGAFFPGRSRGCFAHQGGYPRRCVSTTVTELGEIHNATGMQSILGGSGWWVHSHDKSVEKSVFIPGGSLIGPTQLATISEALDKGQRRTDALMVNQWPKARDSSTNGAADR